jgi:PKD repeat protein
MALVRKTLFIGLLLFMGMTHGLLLAEANNTVVAPNVPSGPGLEKEVNRAGFNLHLDEDYTLDEAVKMIVNYVLGFLALVAVLTIIYAGVRLVASAGNDDAKENAKKILTYAVIGLLLVTLSWSIVEFVINSTKGGTDGSGGSSGGGSRAPTVEVVIPGVSGKSIFSAGRTIVLPVTGVKQTISIQPIFSTEILGRATSYSWETVEYIPKTAFLERFFPIVEAKTSWDEGIFDPPPPGNCANVCSLQDILLEVAVLKEGDLKIKLNLYDAEKKVVGTTTLSIRMTKDAPTALPNLQDDPSLMDAEVNKGKMRIDRSVGGNSYFVEVPEQKEGTEQTMKIIFRAGDLPVKVASVMVGKVGGTPTNALSSNGSNLVNGELLVNLGVKHPAVGVKERYMVTVTSSYAGGERKKIIEVLFNGAERNGIELRGADYFDALFTVKVGTETKQVMNGGGVNMLSPQNVVFDAKVNTNIADIFKKYQIVLDNYHVIKDGEISGTTYNISGEINQKFLQMGKRYSVKIIFKTGDSSIQRSIFFNLGVGTDAGNGETALGLSPKISFPKPPNRATDQVDPSQVVTVALRDEGNAFVVPTSIAKDHGITFSVKGADGKFYTTLPEVDANIFSNCEWDFGNGERLKDAACGPLRTYYKEEGTYTAKLKYATSGLGLKEDSYRIFVKAWAPEIKITPQAAYQEGEFTFSAGDTITQSDPAIIRRVLGVSANSALNREKVEWKIYKTSQEAIEGTGTPLVSFSEEAPRKSFKGVEGILPGKEYFARFEVTYGYTGTAGATRTVFSNYKSFRVLNREPEGKLSVQLKNPEIINIYRLDASGSYDNDASALTYEWWVQKTKDANGIALTEQFKKLPESTNSPTIDWTVKEKGTYIVRVVIKDANGGETIKEQTIVQKSVLAFTLKAGGTTGSQLDSSMVIVRRTSDKDAEVRFVIEGADSDIKYYTWNFGDGTTENTLPEQRERSHTYIKAGSYTVTVEAHDSAENILRKTKTIYVADADKPKAIGEVEFPSETTSLLLGAGKTSCKNTDGRNVNAYRVTRGTVINFTGAQSVNRDGTTQNMTYRWKVGGVGEKNTSAFTQRFPQLSRAGECYQATLTVIDQDSNKSDVSDPLYFEVVNGSPTIGALRVYPQKVETPAEIRLFAENVRDLDGQVTKYTWFYYKEGENPDERSVRKGIQETSQPQAYITIPESGPAGTYDKYHFAVLITDNDNTVTKSYESLGGPSQIVTVKNSERPPLLLDITATPSDAKVGDTVMIRAQARLQGVQQVINGPYFSYDMDGDGRFDIFNQSSAYPYKYTGNEGKLKDLTETGKVTFNVKAQVFYGSQVKDASTTVSVTKTINKPKAAFEYKIVGDRVYFTSTSVGEGLRYAWDLDAPDAVTCASPLGTNQATNFTEDSNVSTPTKQYNDFNTAHGVILKIANREGQMDCIRKNVTLLKSAAPEKAPLEKVTLEANKTTVKANEEVLFTVRAYDQVGKEMSGRYFDVDVDSVQRKGFDLTNRTQIIQHRYPYSGRETDFVEKAGKKVATYEVVARARVEGKEVLSSPLKIEVEEAGVQARIPLAETITLEADKTVLQEGEVVRFTAYAYDKEKLPVTGKVFSYDMDANKRPGYDFTNRSSVVQYKYTYAKNPGDFTREGATQNQVAEYTVKARMEQNGKIIESNPLKITVRKFAEEALTIDAFTLEASKTTLKENEPVSFIAKAKRSDGTLLSTQTFSYDLDGDGTFDVQESTNTVRKQYDYSTYARQFVASTTNSGEEQATFQVKARVEYQGKTQETEPLTITVIRRTGAYLEPYIEYISPNPGAFAENMTNQKEMVIPLEATAEKGVTLSLRRPEEEGSSYWNQFDPTVEWNTGDGSAPRTQKLEEPMTVIYREAGMYVVTAKYKTKEGLPRQEQFTLVVVPWKPHVSILPEERANMVTGLRVSTDTSIVEDYFSALKKHLETEREVTVREGQWTIVRKDNGKEIAIATIPGRSFTKSLMELNPEEAKGGEYLFTYTVYIDIQGETPRVYQATKTLNISGTSRVEPLTAEELAKEYVVNLRPSATHIARGETITFVLTATDQEGVTLKGNYFGLDIHDDGAYEKTNGGSLMTYAFSEEGEYLVSGQAKVGEKVWKSSSHYTSCGRGGRNIWSCDKATCPSRGES